MMTQLDLVELEYELAASQPAGVTVTMLAPLTVPPEPADLADAFVAANRALLHGWPAADRYIDDGIQLRLMHRLRPMLPDRLVRMHPYYLYRTLTKAVNKARERDRAAYRTQCDDGEDGE